MYVMIDMLSRLYDPTAWTFMLHTKLRFRPPTSRSKYGIVFLMHSTWRHLATADPPNGHHMSPPNSNGCEHGLAATVACYILLLEFRTEALTAEPAPEQRWSIFWDSFAQHTSSLRAPDRCKWAPNLMLPTGEHLLANRLQVLVGMFNNFVV